MAFVRNAWYLGAYAREIVAGQLFPRTLLGDAVVFYRDDAGKIVALADLCPHRFASLHRGQLSGNDVECAYHGLRFGPSGECTFNPHGSGKIPATARVRTYPVEVKYDRVWIWMGDSELMDRSKLPKLDHFESPAMRTLDGLMKINAHYVLALDNLMDLSHTQFIHKEFLASDYLRGTLDVQDEGEGVLVSVWIPNGSAPPNFKLVMKNPDEPVDHWIETRWFSPATVTIDFGTTAVGAPRSEGIFSIGVHIVTPETESSSHYFYANSRSFALDDPTVDEQRRTFQERAFREQDGPIIENCFQNMGTGDLFSLQPVLLSSDAGAIRVRRRIESMVADEARAFAGTGVHA
jgi:phenylpropionate dioxygenase-like ring-hydroxylating dioxygenase large terminal subunit